MALDYDCWLMGGIGGPEDNRPVRTCAICKDEIDDCGPEICPLCEQDMIDAELAKLEPEQQEAA